MKYRILDLFSGCGGITKGFFDTQKVDVIGAIDFDKYACETYKYNFPDAKVIHDDINKISVESTEFQNIDIIVGGPPCQGFSGLNRWNKDLENDPRNKLVFQYLRFVKTLKPKALLIENVRQILTSKNGEAKRNICLELEKMGYNVKYRILNAAEFGVPQNRFRAIFVAIRKDLGDFDFSILDKYKKNKITVEDAISDITEIEDTVRKNLNSTNYKLKKPKSKYQRAMRNKDNTLNNHLVYYPIKSVLDKIKYVPEGGNWKNVPENLFKTKRDNRHSNYLKRLDSKTQSITIDTGHNVYFHPKFNRVPTIRESARLQSFPDDFHFLGTKGAQFKQVGNAVPPLLAKALASSIMEVLENEK